MLDIEERRAHRVGGADRALDFVRLELGETGADAMRSAMSASSIRRSRKTCGS
ncbi:MAG: hypothetical protein WAT93_13700 [Pontixanthobacter sp.]